MTTVIIITLALIAIIVVQIGRLIELSASIRGEEEAEQEANNRNAWGMLVFLFVFLAACIYSSAYYAPTMLGYGIEAASEHGDSLDQTFNITLVLTGIVFIITHILLFWFAYKYRRKKGKKSIFISHDNKLEVIWTVIPAVVMTFLVISGLETWNEVTADIQEGEDYTEIEATGYQWAWIIRYPGADNLLGTRNFRKINTANNPLGQEWEDEKNLDDFHPNDIVLPVGKKVRVRITARDVLHNFYLPHFRLKMDAVPGMPTYFVFTPKYTTEEYRQILKDNPSYQGPADETEPDGKKRWEAFEYELACAELCGKGHYSMRKVVRIVSQEEYDAWLKEQTSFYEQNVKGKAGVDPLLSVSHDDHGHEGEHHDEEAHEDEGHEAEGEHSEEAHSDEEHNEGGH
ncbi:MAG: cytochrome c oxidase subunit II transmembrane domain-containing protein [Saprospiraceae bacterium]